MLAPLPRFVRPWLRRARHHAEAERRLLPGLYRPWRRVIRPDGAVVAERRRRDGSVADVMAWGDYLAIRNRHRELAAGTRAYVKRNRWRWAVGGVLALFGIPKPFRP
jgi:hypothetical protein